MSAVEAARAIGYPVAVKLLSTTITHKTDGGGVELDVVDDARGSPPGTLAPA